MQLRARLFGAGAGDDQRTGAVLIDDLAQLLPFDRFNFQQPLRDRLERLAARFQDVARLRERFVQHAPHFGIDLLGGRFAVQSRVRTVAAAVAEERRLVALTVIDPS